MIETLALILVLGWASYRVCRFLLFDSLIGMADPGNELEGEPPTSPMAVRLDKFAYEDDGSDRSWVRGRIGDLFTCPWCTGFWTSVGVYALFTWSLPWQVESPQNWVLIAFAIAGVQGFIQSRMNA